MIGRELGPYRLESEIGNGAMGRVYRVTALTDAPGVSAGTTLALKVVHPQLLASPGFFKRFLREAETGKTVRHLNVVRTFDADAIIVDGQQHHYLAMEYVEGKSLRELLDDLGTVPETLLREVALQAADGLCAIHAAGVVHRDLKPENILITDDHDVRIMDLGVAKLQEASIALTLEGQFVGTMLYAAPEQIDGNDVGPRSDLYSLGVLLYELATGAVPFPYDQPGALIQAHMAESPPSLREHCPDVSPFFAEVVTTLLAKRPEDRFPSAEALHGVLRDAERSPWWAERAAFVEAAAKRLPRITVDRSTRLYGRDGPLKKLRDAWARAARGAGNTLFIEGEPGIGKTRLLDTFLRECGKQDAHVLYGAYLPFGAGDGIAEAILAKFGEADLVEGLRRYLPLLGSLVPGLAALLKREPVPLGAQPVSSDGLQTLCVHLMRELAREKPVVWAVDDFHIGSREGRNLVLAAARAVEGHRALLVVTTQPGMELASYSRLANFDRAVLDRLSVPEVTDLLDDAFGGGTLAEKLGGRIARKSDGVPFLVFELVRELKDGGFIRPGDLGSYVQARSITDIEVPSAVKDLVHNRLRDLTTDQRRVLDAGAVQGLTFDVDLVARSLDTKRIDVLRTLAEIERGFGLVHSDATTCGFDQNHVREVLYDDLAPRLRAEYHSLLAEAYAEQCTGDAVGEDAVVLASHHLRGRSPEAGLPYVETALQHLVDSYRNEPALELAESALAVETLTAHHRADLLARKGELLDLLGYRNEATTAYEESVALADVDGDAVLRARVRRMFGYLLTETGQVDQAQTLLEDAVALARRAGDRELEAAATGALGGFFHRADRYEPAVELHQRYVEMSRELGLVRDEAIATGNLGLAYWSMARYDEAVDHLQRARKLARQEGNRRGEAIVAGNLGIAYVDLGRFEEAQAQQEESRRLAREIGHRYAESLAVGNLGTVFLEMGRYARAREQYARHLELSREIGDLGGEAIAECNLALVCEVVGRWKQGGEHARRSYDQAHENNERSIKGYALASIGTALEFTGDLDGAVQRYREAIDIAREIGHNKSVADVLCALGRVRAKQGRGAAAIRHLDEATALARDLDVPSTEVMALCRRVSLEGGDAQALLDTLSTHEPRIAHSTKTEARFVLWEATGDAAQLAKAHTLLMEGQANAPEADRESMLRNVPLHAAIVEAWASRP